jgi:outer membrane protein assembly factor BamA
MAITPDGIVTIHINEGIINDIKVLGNGHTASYVIRREMILAPNEVLSVEALRRGMQNIIGTGLFEQVFIDVVEERGKNILYIHVTEKSSEEVRTGIRLDNERNFQMLLELQQVNVRDAGEEASFTFAGGFRNRTFRIRYNVNRLFHSYFTGNVKIYHKFRDAYIYGKDYTEHNALARKRIGEFHELKYGGALSFGTQVARFGNINAEWRMENHQVLNVADMNEKIEEHRFTLSSIKMNMLVDSENEFYFPTSGVRFSLAYEIATKEIGSEQSFTKIYAMHQSYWSPFTSHTIRPRITFGFADATLPFTEQFSLGGMESFFGVPEDDSRGRELFLVNLEYRYRLPFKLLFPTYCKLRYDMGMISTEIRSIHLRNFQHGAGVELALDTPIGSASLSAGKEFLFLKQFPKTKVISGPLLFYFSIGHRF